MHRRQLLRYVAAAGAGQLLLPHAWAGRGATGEPFALGVASGAPHPSGVTLWTRIAPDALPSPVSELLLRWEIADDAGFAHIAASGRAAALPPLGHSVHVDVQGLAPDRWYFYRFLLGDAVSDTGRTRTAPAADALPGRLRFAFASCQRWDTGHYAAWRDLASQSPDLVVFLGDYIYENALPRQPAVAPVRSHTLRHALTLADYRDRYALHKSDPHLRAAHHACPWIATWDDHEVENDYAGTAGRAAPDTFAVQRAAAYQAYYENMPLPAHALLHGPGGLGAADAVRVHQRYGFGRLARFHLLDTRQFRDVQACRDLAPGAARSSVVRPAECPALDDPARSMLGRAQEAWLDQGLAEDARDGRTRWTVIAQQTLFSPRHYGGPQGPVPTDPWDGYPAARRRLIESIAGHAPRNTVFVGGDIHQNFVSNLHAGDIGTSPVLAAEFCGTSISSPSGASQDRIASLLLRNPQVVFANSEKRGYGLAELTPSGWHTRLRSVDRIEDPQSAVGTLAEFTVQEGRPGIAQR